MANWLGNDADDRWQMWLYGVIAPLPVVGIALMWIISRHADLHDPKMRMVLFGTDAVALGLTALFLALALHFHFFWRLSQSPLLNRYHSAGTMSTLLAAVFGFLYLIWCLVRLCILS